MPSSSPAKPPVFFENARAFRAWLEENASRETEVFVGYYKVGSGRPSITWPESVDEALCFGWIDGLRRRLDEHSYQIRFTPRRQKSTWSAVNIARAGELTAQGRMRPAGLEAFGRRRPEPAPYSYEQRAEPRLRIVEIREFKKNPSAWNHFEKLPPGCRRAFLRWVTSAKQEATRQRRLAELIKACAAGRRLFR